MKSEVTERHKQIARAIVQEGKPISRALIEGGISPTQARKGMKRITHTRALRQSVEDELKKWAKETGKILRVAAPEKRAEMVRARLALNVATGEDRAVHSCKLMGQDKEVRMWEPEVRAISANWIINNMPPEIRARYFGDEEQDQEGGREGKFFRATELPPTSTEPEKESKKSS
ncbi:MAG: hypothetical protein A3H27_13365 [Acidobacteria bacterium RIFCSPLOWO2_02_FULL_59_13]|nr:MAG: hypothetical protein A3H27_13365 [Acidobacteria bacterium RIFCSPLOWO2_02_FULL_59_13]